MLPVFGTMKKIADYQQANRVEIPDLCKQSLQVFFKCCLWYANAVFPEMPGFADMKIRQQQYLFFFPKQRTAACKQEMVVMYVVKQIWLHGCKAKWFVV